MWIRFYYDTIAGFFSLYVHTKLHSTKPLLSLTSRSFDGAQGKNKPILRCLRLMYKGRGKALITMTKRKRQRITFRGKSSTRKVLVTSRSRQLDSLLLVWVKSVRFVLVRFFNVTVRFPWVMLHRSCRWGWTQTPRDLLLPVCGPY